MMIALIKENSELKVILESTEVELQKMKNKLSSMEANFTKQVEASKYDNNQTYVKCRD